jgi:beta-glucosidase
LLGQAGGAALADVLYGVVNPSGRLAETIPLRLEDTTAFGVFPGEQGQVVYGERTLVGYRGYATRGTDVRYAFGHGLSYTTFRTSGFEVETTGDDTARVRVTVENTGDRDGASVVQVYVDASNRGIVQRSSRELRAFRKVHIAAGASVVFELELDRRAFAYWDTDLHDWIVTPGEYGVIVGRDALTTDHEVVVDLIGDHVIRELTLWSTAAEWFEHELVGPVLLETLDSPPLKALAQPATLRMLGSLPMQKVVNMLGDTVSRDDVDALMVLSRNGR